MEEDKVEQENIEQQKTINGKLIFVSLMSLQQVKFRGLLSR
jgi:hypothetical protein